VELNNITTLDGEELEITTANVADETGTM